MNNVVTVALNKFVLKELHDTSYFCYNSSFEFDSATNIYVENFSCD